MELENGGENWLLKVEKLTATVQVQLIGCSYLSSQLVVFVHLSVESTAHMAIYGPLSVS
jgi:hypothetical protein